MTKVVVFDFDGVIVVDSDGLFKKEGWEMVFRPYRGRYEPLLEEAKSLYGGGKLGGRREIFTHVYRQLGVPEEAIDSLVAAAWQTFDDHVQTRIRHAGLAKGATALLTDLVRQKINLYLNSSTPDEPLRASADSLGISHFFRGLLGCSKSKLDNFKLIAQTEGVGPTEFLYIGDSLSDFEVALAFGCRFLGITNPYNGWRPGQEPFTVIQTLPEVKNFLDCASLTGNENVPEIQF